VKLSRDSRSAPMFWWHLLNPRMLGALVMGFSSGLPLLLTLSTMQAWLKQRGVDLGLIGLSSLLGLPYTLKFLWAPVFDRFTLPGLGRRRGWLLVTQLACAGAIGAMGVTDPVARPWLFTVFAFLVTFFSASQDIVIDSYRREILTDEELGLGSSLYVNGYRLALLISGGGALVLADRLSWPGVYAVMAALMSVGVGATLLSREPAVLAPPPRSFREAVVDPFVEYFGRPGAWTFLLFILLYKLGDSMASALTTPFYLDLGFSNSQIGAVVKGFGFAATLAGGFVGGLLILRLGIGRALWLFGILQAASTAGFVWLAYTGASLTGLSAVIATENFTGGMGTSAFVAFMASLTNKRFTATQYALLSSLMGVPRVLAAAPTGYLAKALGWPGFFIFCTIVAVPGLLLLTRVRRFAAAGGPGSPGGVVARS
jgi:PAT family beta-lactamase induction signal transducer AmpG